MLIKPFNFPSPYTKEVTQNLSYVIKTFQLPKPLYQGSNSELDYRIFIFLDQF